MKTRKRVLCALVAVLLSVAGLVSIGIGVIVMAWPNTNSQVGASDNAFVATPYLIAASILLITSGYLLWFGFRRANPPHA